MSLVLLDTLSTKRAYRWIRTLGTCSCVCGIGATVIEVPIFIHITNFELTAW